MSGSASSTCGSRHFEGSVDVEVDWTNNVELHDARNSHVCISRLSRIKLSDDAKSAKSKSAKSA